MDATRRAEIEAILRRLDNRGEHWFHHPGYDATSAHMVCTIYDAEEEGEVVLAEGLSEGIAVFLASAPAIIRELLAEIDQLATKMQLE